MEKEKPVELPYCRSHGRVRATDDRGEAQFLLCHHHEDAETKLGTDFRSVQLGTHRLLPVAAPGLLAEGDSAQAPQLSYTAESGMGRILASAWKRSGLAPPAHPAFSSDFGQRIDHDGAGREGVAWTARSLIEEDLET